MSLHLEENVFYYNNSDADGVAPRISRDLVGRFFRSFSDSLVADESVDFISRTRIPVERELYGSLVKSLMSSELQDEISYIATEVQVGRGEDKKGRVDIFFNYRNVSFLVEFKVARIGLQKHIPTADADPEDCMDPIARIRKPWCWGGPGVGEKYGAVSQLEELNVESLNGLLRNRVVKLPVVLYLHCDWRKGSREDLVSTKNIPFAIDFHSSIIGNLVYKQPDFQFFCSLETPIRTRSRRTELEGGNQNMTWYGFSLIASALG